MLRVPDRSARESVPATPCQVAVDYLLDDSRIKRRETTIELGFSNVGPRVVDVECSLPSGWGARTWYLPLAYFPKADVAPNLEIADCDGNLIPIPTKLQNYAITQQALEELISSGRFEAPSPSEVRELIDEVISKNPFEASVSRWIFENRAASQHSELLKLLRLLEENFVLWVPVQVQPLSEHQFRIVRQENREPDRIFVPRLLYAEREVATAAGVVEIRGEMIEGDRPEVRFGAIFERLPKALGVRPVEAVAVDAEAGRATSAHLRVQAPPGFVVRNIRAGELPSPEDDDPQIAEMDPYEEGVVIQGWDQKLGHVHLSKPVNPQLYCMVTLGPRSGLITLWMMATTLTAVVLWVLHHHSKYGGGTPHLHSHLIFSEFAGGGRRGEERLAISSNNKQIAAAVLLVGPALASAWALRAEGGELLRSFFAGTRILLLLSAAISIAAALALAGVHPTGINGYRAMEIYSGLAYLVAAPMAAAWLLSLRPVWDLFREVFDVPLRNLLLVGLVGSIAVATGICGFLPARLAGSLLLASGLVLALVGANSVAEPLRIERKEAHYRVVAGIGAIALTVIAGAFLGFYASLFPINIARIACIVLGVELIWCAGRLRSALVSE